MNIEYMKIHSGFYSVKARYTLMLAYLLIAIVLGLFVGYLASEKGRSFGGWFLLSLVVSPLLSLIGLLVVGDADG